MEHTCIFTEDILPDDNAVEHAIPEGIGGKISSRWLTTSSLNHDAGDWCDKALVECYRALVMRLSPLMRSPFKNLKLHGETADGKPAIIGPGWSVKPKSVIKKTDENGRDIVYVDTGSAGDYMKHLESRGEIANVEIVDHAEAYGGGKAYAKLQLTGPDIVVAVAKLIFCSFEYFLQENKFLNVFTRDPATKDIRTLVSESIKTKKADPNIWDKYFLGMQYEAEEKIKSELSLFDSDLFGRYDFSHLIAVSADTATKAIHATFYAFGYDPWGFILTRNWTGPAFSYVIKQTVLSDGVAPTIMTKDFPIFVAGPSSNKPWLAISSGDSEGAAIESHKTRLIEKIQYHLHDACNRACYYVEVNDLGMFKGNIKEAVKIYYVSKGKPFTISQVLLRRLLAFEIDGLDSLEAIEKRLAGEDKETACILTDNDFFNSVRQNLDNIKDDDWNDLYATYKKALTACLGLFRTIGGAETKHSWTVNMD